MMHSMVWTSQEVNTDIALNSENEIQHWLIY